MTRIIPKGTAISSLVGAALALSLVRCASINDEQPPASAQANDGGSASDVTQHDVREQDSVGDTHSAAEAAVQSDAADSAIDDDAAEGSTPVATAVLPLLNGAAFYPRVIRLQSGTIAASVIASQASGRLGLTLLQSRDDGVTFSIAGHIDDSSFSTGLCCGTLYELPRAFGGRAQGTLLWAASVGADTPAAPMSIKVWSSANEGATWSEESDAVVAGVPRSGGGLWEPEFSLLDDGSLICHYSDETSPGHSQRLAAVRSTDGVHWGAPVATVSLNDSAARPGMANVRRGPGGMFFMSYELCGPASCSVHMRTSNDGSNWGDPNDPGFVPRTVDGREFRHAPTLVWNPSPGQNGRFYLVGQLAFDNAGNRAPESGSVVFVNTEGAHQAWYEIAAPVPVPSAYDNFCPNYSSPLLPLDNGAFGLELASKYDGTVCRTYFARSGLLGTGDSAGITMGNTVRIVSVQSGLCLDGASGAGIQQTSCANLATQKWIPESIAGGARLHMAGSASCLSVAGDAGTQATLAACDASAAQTWTLQNVGSSYYTLGHGSGMCLDVSGGSTSAGTPIEQWTCNQLSPQIWHFEPN